MITLEGDAGGRITYKDDYTINNSYSSAFTDADFPATLTYNGGSTNMVDVTVAGVLTFTDCWLMNMAKVTAGAVISSNTTLVYALHLKAPSLSSLDDHNVYIGRSIVDSIAVVDADRVEIVDVDAQHIVVTNCNEVILTRVNCPSVTVSQVDCARLNGGSLASVTVSDSFVSINRSEGQTVSLSNSSFSINSAKYLSVSVDGSSAGNIHSGSISAVSTPGKSGVVVGSGVMVNISGTDMKISAGKNKYEWINLSWWARIGANFWTNVRGEVNIAADGPAIFQSGATVDVTSPPKVPIWDGPGGYSPLTEPPK